MKHCAIILSLPIFLLCSCRMTPHLEIGRDFNQLKSRVMDTASDFHLNDNFLAQVYNEQPFGFDSLDMRVYRGDSLKHELMFEKRLPVDPNAEYFILKGRNINDYTMRKFLRTDSVGYYYLEFSHAGNLIAGKTFTMHSSKEKP